jgi:HAD superfamily hydrolase (TIGR01509 family)
MPGAKELVDSLRTSEVPMALVSASPRVLVDATLQLLPSGTFLSSISSQDVKESKPHPMSYLLAAEHLGVKITSCLVLEDSKTGITAGLASGAVVIGIPHVITYPASPKLHIRRDLVDVTPESLNEIFVAESKVE